MCQWLIQVNNFYGNLLTFLTAFILAVITYRYTVQTKRQADASYEVVNDNRQLRENIKKNYIYLIDEDLFRNSNALKEILVIVYEVNKKNKPLNKETLEILLEKD